MIHTARLSADMFSMPDKMVLRFLFYDFPVIKGVSVDLLV
jgi:hypothetical protein